MMELTGIEVANLVIRAFPSRSRTAGEIVSRIRDWMPDQAMSAPTDRNLVAVAKTIPVRQWSPTFDCDNFSAQYWCAAHNQQIDGKQWCVGRVIFEETPTMDSPHEMCLAIVDYKGVATVRVIEPQQVGKSAAAHLLRKPSSGYMLRYALFG